MRAFFNYYKWHLIFFLLILVCIIFISVRVTTKEEPDVILAYVGDSFVNNDDFNNNKSIIELMLNDANKDGKRIPQMSSYMVDSHKDMVDVFEQVIETESYHVYIAPKAVFEEIEDKSVFAKFSHETGNLGVLKKSNGDVYAVSVEDNTLLVNLGIRDTKGLYIAAADFPDEELSNEEKNGINITKEIIEKRKDY